jgi:hypothetical protein
VVCSWDPFAMNGPIIRLNNIFFSNRFRWVKFATFGWAIANRRTYLKKYLLFFYARYISIITVGSAWQVHRRQPYPKRFFFSVSLSGFRHQNCSTAFCANGHKYPIWSSLAHSRVNWFKYNVSGTGSVPILRQFCPRMGTEPVHETYLNQLTRPIAQNTKLNHVAAKVLKLISCTNVFIF